MTDLEYARKYFEGDRYAVSTTGAVIDEVGKGMSLISLKLDDRHKNALGHVMGGVYAAVADFAFAVASQYDEYPTVTLSSSINYLAPVKGDCLFARCSCLRNGRTACFYEAVITDGDGTLCAKASFAGYKIKASAKVPEEAAAEPDPYRRWL